MWPAGLWYGLYCRVANGAAASPPLLLERPQRCCHEAWPVFDEVARAYRASEDAQRLGVRAAIVDMCIPGDTAEFYFSPGYMLVLPIA